MNSLSDRMKDYENVSRIYLPRRTYIMCRVDGRAFHTWTKGLDKPFDVGFIEDMNTTAAYLCQNISGAKFAYVQSDEISILITDFDSNETQPWFENNLQKMASVTASMATAKFNQLRLKRLKNGVFANEIDEHPTLAVFDCRFWQIPSKIEVENYMIFRQQDATRNSISSVAQSLYSHKELHGVSSDAKQELIFQKGINWNDYPSRMKRGGFIEKVGELWIKPKASKSAGIKVPEDEVKNQRMFIDLHGSKYNPDFEYYERTHWETVECPIFTQDRQFLNIRIPSNG